MAVTGWAMADLVREVCHDEGAGPLLPGGAMAGYRAFADAVPAGATFPYMIMGVTDPAQWEAGTGVLDGDGRIVRTPVASSAGGAAVDFGPGEKRIGLALHAGWVAAVEGHGHGIGGVEGLADALAGRQAGHANLSALAGQAGAADRLSYWTGAATLGLTPLTAKGRALIGGADAAAMREELGLSALAVQHPASVAISGGTIAGITDLAVADGGTGASSAGAARSNLGLAIGSDVQAYDAGLAAVAALTTAAFGRGVLTCGDAASARSYIGAGTSSTNGTVTSVDLSAPAGLSVSGAPVTGAGTIALSYASGYQGYSTVEATKLAGVATGATANTGTVTSVGLSVPTGLSVSGTPVTAAGTISIGYAAGYQGYSSAEATKLSGIATGATANVGTVTSVALSGGATGLSASGGPITGSGTLTLAGTLALANGGTGATTAAAARTALGLGTIATQTASAVTIIGGSITNISALQASSASGAMTVLIDAPAGQSAGHYLRSGTSARWLLRKGGGTEAGGNVGSDLLIERFDDSGAAIASAISVERATGTVTLGGITRPSTDNNRSCGTAALRWSELFAGSGTVNTSDARLKTDVEPFDDALLDAWSAIGWVRYRWRDALAEKGPEAARWHGGLIAQQVRDAIDARLGEGAAVRLGLLCHDSWEAIPEERDDEGVVLRPAVEAGERWGLRYDECFALEAAWLRRKLARIEALMGGDDDAG